MTRPWMVTALVVAGFAFAASPSQAALSITVSTTADNVSGNTTANVGSCATGGACTLRQAINTADITANAGSTITVPAGMYVISNAAGFGDLPQIYKSTTINGGINASTIIDGGSAATGLTYAFDLADDGTNAVTSTLNNLTIQHFVKGNQGIVYVHPTQNGSVVNFNNGVIQNNASSDGGAGIINTGHGTVRVDSSEIKGNNSAGASNGAAGDLEVSVAANLVVTNSAVVNNTGHASAICIGCQFATTGTTFTFTNNTISGNVLTGQPVINDAKGLATFSYNTIANNTPGSGSAVINRSAASGDNFKGNIVSGNTGTNCAFTGAAPTKSGFNYDSGTTCGFEHPSTAVTLGTLQNNGGPTDTQALPPGSPVIDTGGTGGACTTAGGSALTSDQRATPRPQGTQCDPGAYEALSGPTCQGLTKTTGAGQPLAIQLSCAGTGTLTYAIVGNPSHGSLSGFNASTGAVTYTPTAGYFGPDSFTYNATNAGGTSSTVTVAITVTTPPPTCRAVQASTKISVPVSIHLDCSDAAAAPLTYSIDTPPSHGGLGSVDQSTGNVTYTPVAGFAGNDSFVYHATSSNGTTSTQLVTIFVSESGAPPAAPTCRAVQASTGAGAPVTIQFSCTDEGGAALTYAVDANPGHGALSALNQTSTSVLYTPVAGFAGADSFTYHATSVNGSSQVVTVSITVGTAPPPAAPVFTVAKLTNTTFAVDPKGSAETPVAAAKKPKPAKKGTTFQFTLSEAARVVYTVELVGSGRSVKGKCVKPSKSNRKSKKCVLYTRVGRFAQNAVAGANTKKFSGRIGKTTLKPGTYRATLIAKDAAGKTSKAKTLAFKIVKK